MGAAEMETLSELIKWYEKRGAPSDQQELRSLLRELAQQTGGVIGRDVLTLVANALQVKESFLQAIARRTSGIRLDDRHVLEICAGPNCGKHTALLKFAETLDGVTVKTVPCMRLCGKGPNIRWDGELHNRADEKLLRKLLETE